MSLLTSRRIPFRVGTIVLLLGVTAALVAPGEPASAAGANPVAMPTSTPADRSTAVVNSTMTRNPSATSLGGWGYQVGFALYGTYLVYQRTHNPKYLSYVKSWVDAHVDAKGNISNSFDNLDSMQAGNLLVLLYQQTKQARYRTAAQKIRTRLNSYPRTTDGGFWHATSKPGQLWLDGTYMSMPFLLRYGAAFDDATYARNEAAKQVLIDASHLAAPNGLLYHAYDENDISWADPKTHHSAEFWCRAIGWYGMTTVDTLDNLPADHPDRPKLLTVLNNLVGGFAKYQDPKTGRWFQVVDKGSVAGNWTETSCSAMYTYIVHKSVRKGYVPASYADVAQRGYQGVLAEVSLDSKGLTDIANICQGTNVGDLAYYLARPRSTNDPHGLGAFLVMSEELSGNPLA
jgi:unsaturated rhamnogalacturonyl hydrolase